MYPLIDNVAKQFCDYIEQEICKNPSITFDARDISLRYSCNSISSTTYAIDAQAFTENPSDILHFGIRLWKNIIGSTSSTVSKEVNQFFVDFMKQAIQYRRYNNLQSNDLLNFIISLKDKKNSSDIESAAHGVTFFLNGFETSSIALCYTLYELSINMNVQEKLRNEIVNACDENQEISIENLLNLPYLDQVFYEVLRLHPPLVYTSRVCNDDIELKFENEKQLIVKGTNIWIPIYSIHRDPEYFENPNEFHPERFDEEFGGVKAFRDKSVLIPFGDGSRICLGMKLGTLQVKAAVFKIIKNFKIISINTTDEDVKINSTEFVNLPNGKISLQFVKIS